MIWLLNRYSYLITAALAMGTAWIVGARFGGPWPTVAVAGVGIGLALVQRKLRGSASDASAWSEIDTGPGTGQPLLLFLYSNT